MSFSTIRENREKEQLAAMKLDDVKERMRALRTINPEDEKDFYHCQLLESLNEQKRKDTKMVVASRLAIFVILKSNRILAFGPNWRGAMGVGHGRQMTKFDEIRRLKGLNIKQFHPTEARFLILTEEGDLYSFETVPLNPSDHRPRLLLTDMVKMAGFAKYALMLRIDGRVYSFGDGSAWHLGWNTAYERQGIWEQNPKFVEGLLNVVVVDMVAAKNIAAALTDTGKVYCWGEVFRSRHYAAQEVVMPEHAPIKMINTNNVAIFCLTTEGKVYIVKSSEPPQLFHADFNYRFDCFKIFNKLIYAWNEGALHRTHCWVDCEDGTYQSALHEENSFASLASSLSGENFVKYYLKGEDE